MSIATELQDLNDNILDAYTAVQGKGGTVPANKNMANLPTAINSISAGSPYDIPRERRLVSSNGILAAPSLDTYTVPNDINKIGSYALACAFDAAYSSSSYTGSVKNIDLNNVEEVYPYGLYQCSGRSNSSGALESLSADNLVTARENAFTQAFQYFKGDTISFPALTTASSSAFSEAFYLLTRGNVGYTPATASFPELTSCGSYAFSKAFYQNNKGGGRGLSSASFPKLETTGSYAFNQAFNDNSNMTSANFNSLKTIGDNAFNGAFLGCDSLASLSFPELTTAGASAFSGFGLAAAGLTSISFPKLTTIGKSCFSNACTDGIKIFSLPELVTASESAFSYMFASSSSSSHIDVQKASFPKLETVAKNTFSYAFAWQTVISSVGGIGCDVELPVLKTAASQSFMRMFANCTSLTTATFPALKEVTGATRAFDYMFSGCTSLTTVSFPVLDTVPQGTSFYYMCQNCTSLSSLSFPALTTSSFGSSTDQFNSMLSGCSNVTVHFPDGLQTKIASMNGYPNFGGTNTTVLFDL